MVFSSIIHYNEGTLVIDFYDAVKKNLIFQGTLTTVVKDKPQKREKSIPENVAKLMKKYSIKPIEWGKIVGCMHNLKQLLASLFSDGQLHL